jgi:carbamate kinase
MFASFVSKSAAKHLCTTNVSVVARFATRSAAQICRISATTLSVRGIHTSSAILQSRHKHEAAPEPVVRNNRLVVALGGNALQRASQKGTVSCILENAQSACHEIAKLIHKGFRVAVTHGNGPQVGQLLHNTELAHLTEQAPLYPLDVCVAQSQGFLGYVLAQSLDYELTPMHLQYPHGPTTVPIVTQMIVEPTDPAFSNPTKPVGEFYSEEEAMKLQERGVIMKEDSGRGWRQVVPSPMPKEIIEKDAIQSLYEASHESKTDMQRFVVLAAGGGGIPVVYRWDRSATDIIRGVPAVVDKDHSAVLMAEAVNVSLCEEYCFVLNV